MGDIDAVFIWIPKCAGSTVHKMLDCPMYRHDYQRKEFLQDPKGIVTFGHAKYSKLDTPKGYSPFKFAFVRNPYERMVSLYTYHRKNRGRFDGGFLEYVQMISEGITPVGAFNVRGFSPCNPQIDWIKNEEIDFIGRVEHFERDINYVFDRLGLRRRKIQHCNSSEHTFYADYYCPESQAIVEDFYREDFERFGYDRCLLHSEPTKTQVSR